MIDEKNHLVEIHQPDGKSDILQQIEHGMLSVMAGYRNLGRFYRGIISPTLQQYVMMGDISNQTDNLTYDSKLKGSGEKTGTIPVYPMIGGCSRSESITANL